MGTVCTLLGCQVQAGTDHSSLENIPDSLLPSAPASLQCKIAKLQRSAVKVIQNPRREIPVAVSLAPFQRRTKHEKNDSDEQMPVILKHLPSI